MSAGLRVRRAARAPHGAKRANAPAARVPAVPKPDAREILAWEDDPMSGAEVVRRPAPAPAPSNLALAIAGTAPALAPHPPGSEAFRYWAGIEALSRGIALWAPHVGERGWAATKRLRVHLDRGQDLNAYYDRKSLSFFHDVAGGRTIYSGESPDVVTHELGHAILDVLRPELWDVMSTEAAAFHESFGDLSALLCGLELASLREAVLRETAGRLFRSSRLSRLAESLGWAIRQSRPDLVAADALRNAVNAFFYRPPSALPPSGPDAQLTSEPHSFSRVFTGGAFEAMGLMLAGAAKRPGEKDLLAVARDFAALLVRAVQRAAIVPAYMSQVAAQMIEADRALLAGRHGAALRTAFVRRGLLSLESATAKAAPPRREAGGESRRTAAQARTAAAEPLPLIRLAGASLGLGRRVIAVRTAGGAPGLAARAAALSTGDARSARPDEAAQAFVEYLVRRGRVDFGPHADRARTAAHPRTRKTHVVTQQTGRLALVRRCFDCGLDPA